MSENIFNTPVAQSKDMLKYVCVQDFEDDYHKDAHDPNDKLMREVRMVRRRYKTTLEYQYAVNIVNKYLALLMVKYGGEDRFISLLQSEAIDEYLPPIPRMKAAPRNKFILKKGLLVSSASFKKLDVDKLYDLSELYAKANKDLKEIPFAERDDPQVKEAEKIIEERGVTNSTSTIYNRANMELDLFEEYFISHVKGGRKKPDHIEQTTDITLRDIMKDDYRENVVDINEDEEEFILHNNAFIRKEDVETVDNLRTLATLGWDQVKLTRRIKGSSRNSLLRLTKNESKKSKKKRKKAERAGNQFLLDLSGQSDKYDSFGDFENAMLDFTSGNRFK